MDESQKQKLQEQKSKIRKYLNSENVSILAGAGTSYHLGAPIIRKLSEELEELEKLEKLEKLEELEELEKLEKLEKLEELEELEKLEKLKELKELMNGYFPEDTTPSLEDLFNCLQADRFLKDQKKEDTTEINTAITEMQTWLFKKCNTEETTLKDKNDEQLQKNRYYYHESFIKKLLQRPNNMKRVNLFTTNYDMAFDYALDNLGVHYINGFMGVHNRCFRPEVYDYDLYYPGESVEGKVHRAEKVLKYYKLHGSLSWLETEPHSNNTYGIKEIPLHKDFKVEDKNLIIYPCTTKKSFTLDLPYSELFRQFSSAIIQAQSVLFCIGYSFYDEHINDIIKQALTIPSFTLIIINHQPKQDDEKNSIKEFQDLEDKRIIVLNKSDEKQDNKEQNNEKNPIKEFQDLEDKRIIILDQNDEEQSTFIGFVKNIMPDLYEEEEREQIAKTMQNLYPDKNNEGRNDGE